MSNINITRHDRGLDSKRIEKIIDMISERVRTIRYDRNDLMKERKAKLKQEIIEKHNLEPEYAAIKSIDSEIKRLEDEVKKLKDKKEPHKFAISTIMRGSESSYDYDRISEGSIADTYIKENIPDVESLKKGLDDLFSEIEEQLWLAKDIEEARGLYNVAIGKIDEVLNEIQG